MRHENILIDVLHAWEKRQGFEPMCAFERLFEDVTEEQRRWLTRYNEAWDRACEPVELAR